MFFKPCLGLRERFADSHQNRMNCVEEGKSRRLISDDEYRRLYLSENNRKNVVTSDLRAHRGMPSIQEAGYLCSGDQSILRHFFFNHYC